MTYVLPLIGSIRCIVIDCLSIRYEYLVCTIKLWPMLIALDPLRWVGWRAGKSLWLQVAQASASTTN